MKRKKCRTTLVFLIFIVVSGCENPQQKASGPDLSQYDFDRYFLFENFVRTSCGASPMSEYEMHTEIQEAEGIALGINYHLGDQLEIEGAVQLYTYLYGKGGIPMLTGMRTNLNTLLDIDYYNDTDYWLYSGEEYYNRISATSPCAIKLSLEDASEEDQLEVKISTAFKEEPQAKLMLTAVLIEKELPPSYQNNHYNNDPESPFYQAGSPIPDYIHRYVARELLSATLGDPLPADIIYTEKEYTSSYTVNIGPEWELENLSLIAFVHPYSHDPLKKTILNVRSLDFE